MQEMPAPPPPVAIVPPGVKCIACGYDLRALAVTLNCPECGEAIARSMEGDRLGGADAAWLRKIVWGQRLFAWGWLLVLMVPLAMIVMMIAFIPLRLSGFGGADWLVAALMFTVMLGGFGGLCLLAMGAFLLTVQDPRESIDERPLSHRRLARAGLVGAVLAYIATIPFSAFISTFGEIAVPLLGVLTLILLTIGLYGMLRMLETLLARVPDATRAAAARSIARVIKWVLPLLMILSIARFLVEPMARGSSDGFLWHRAHVSVMCGSGLLWLLLIAASVRLSFLLFVASRHFKSCLAEARERAESARPTLPSAS